MRAPFSVSLAFATLLLGGPTVAEAAPTDPAPAPAPPAKSTLCTYRDATYGPSAVICIAPKYGLVCGESGAWGKPTGENNVIDACANAQIPVPGALPPQCIYHDVKYNVGSVICVAPYYGQSCSENGRWVKEVTVISRKEASGKEVFYDVCANAQVPIWNQPPANSSTTGGNTSGK
jgi:hypothetical protein